MKPLPFLLCLAMIQAGFVAHSQESEHAGPDCFSQADYFASEVWVKVVAKSCLKCHQQGGDAEDSEFILRDPARDVAVGDPMAHNREAFARMAAIPEGKDSRLLLKARGQLDHGGDEVLAPDSTRYRILAEFVRKVTGGPPSALAIEVPARENLPFFEGVRMISDQGLLRRLTLSLGARLPTAEERAAVTAGGLKAVSGMLDDLMTEDAFYDRLAEGFNDIFLTTGYDEVPENALSYEHFEKTRHWYQKVDHSGAGGKKAQEQAGYKLVREYREAMLREPMELVKHIVREGRPFTELITADYIMVSPFTARGYGIFEEVRDRFRDPENHLEFIPVTLKALTGRSKSTNQFSATGFYPHAGLISTFQYLMRYPTTETNRNRLRVRMYFQQFLGIDIMQLAPRVNDAAAITAKYKVPTMEAADCVVCHKIIDPVAGLFQEYYSLEAKGVYEPRKDGWFLDMFPPGFESEALPGTERWRALQWLGERTAKDPRFAVAMIQHAWYILAGRHALLPPEDIDDPLHAARQRAYQEQRQEIERIAKQFAAAHFDLKLAFRELAVSPFYRADGLATLADKPARQAELEDLGVVRLLSPEQVERKLKAIFGKEWGRLHEQFGILYGGIDSKEVTERLPDPSGAMGAIQRMMSNEVACKNVPADFALDPSKRRLFPGIEPDVIPGDPAAEAEIRTAIRQLHSRILGLEDDPASMEVDRTYALFSGIIAEARERGEFETQEIYSCRAELEKRVEDPHYTLRAWRAVVTYLLRRHEFLYE